MALAPGDRIGSYVIGAQLGVGGMGEVYRARDSKLDRDVAIKIISPAFTEDPERLARFEREARTLASLNHANIAHVYGLEHAEAGHALVMEVVEGDDLSQRLTQGPIPIEDAVLLARQIADAIEAAHDLGIVHRDLKPANIKVRADGVVKVLDFGLAKALDASLSGSAPQLSTMTSPAMTRAGVILGTAAYMSPEQAKGRQVDKRADIWAFGCVVFEMLAGRRPFSGEDFADTLSSIMRDSPAWELLPKDTPPRLRELLARCLEKDPRKRLRDIGEARVALEGDLQGAPASSVVARAWMRDPRSVAAVAVAVLGLGLAARALLVPAAAPAGQPNVVSLSITLPDTLKDVRPPNNTWRANVAISPDEVHMAFSGLRGASPVLFVRRLDAFDLREVSGGGRSPFFSPDGRALAFLRDTDVWRAPIDSLAPVRVGTLEGAAWNVRSELWHPQGDLLFATERGVYRLPDRGGESTLVVKADAAAKQVFTELSLLPDGRVLASSQDGRLHVIDSKTWQITAIEGQAAGRFANGWLFRESPTGLIAVEFDDQRLVTIGEPVAIGGATNSGTNIRGAAALSRGGSVAWHMTAIEPREPVYVDRNGREEPLPFSLNRTIIRWPRLDPSGLQLAFGFSEGNAADEIIQILDLRTGAFRPLPHVNATEPVWFPDGSAVATSAGNFPHHGLMRQSVDGRSDEPLGEQTTFEVWPTSMSKNGELAYYVGTRENFEDFYVLDTGTKKVTRIPRPRLQKKARFSPDGKWIAYQSEEAGVSQVEVVSWPDLAVWRVVSAAGGTEPIWSSDQRELFFRNGDQILSARILPGADFSTAPATVLFSGPYLADPYGDQSWDLAPRDRFLLLKASEASRLEIRMIRNATAALAAKK